MSTLTYEAVIAAGVSVVTESGWSRLSVRAVAAHLGVTPMALYRHIKSSDALSLAVITRIAEGFAEVRNSGDMLADLESWARQAHDALAPFPGAANHLLATWFGVPAALRIVEQLLEVVHRCGLRDFEAVAAVNVVFVYVLMRTEAERTVSSAGAVDRTLSLNDAGTNFAHLSALSRHYTTARFDLHFDYGLRLLLDGIATRLATQTRA